jgi:hypothetical protein
MYAQTRETPLQFSAGAGYGSFGCWESYRCDPHVFGKARGALSAFVGLAKPVSTYVLAGVEVTGRVKDRVESTFTMSTVSAVLTVRPLPFGGLRLRTTLGFAMYGHSAATIDDQLLAPDRSCGHTESLGISYDLQLSRRVALAQA